MKTKIEAAADAIMDQCYDGAQALRIARTVLIAAEQHQSRIDLASAEDEREIDRILTMSDDELRSELVAEGHDPDALVRQMKQGLYGTLRLAADRQRWREEAASWRRVAEQLQERVNRLEEGLQPFGAILAKGEPVGPIPRGLLDRRLTRNDLRRATALLTAPGIEARQGGDNSVGSVEDETPTRREAPNTLHTHPNPKREDR